MFRISIASIVFVIICVYCECRAGAADPIPSAVECEMESYVPWCWVDVGGRRMRFLVDTGSNITVMFSESGRAEWLDSATARQFKNPPPYGLEGFVYRHTPMTVPALFSDPRRHSLRVIDSPAFTAIFSNLDGLIGRDLLCDVRLRLRLKDRRVETGEPRDPQVSGKWISMSSASEPRVRVKFGDFMAVDDFIVDTGCKSPVGIGVKLVDRLIRENEAIVTEQIQTGSAYGKHSARLIYLRRFEIGGVVLENFPAVESNFNVIGLPVLRRFDIDLDFPGRRMRMEPVSDASSFSQVPDGSGIGLSRERLTDGNFKVYSLLERGPGEVAGVREGDTLVAIDGKPCAAMTGDKDVYELFRAGGQTRALSINRDGQSLTIRVPLKWPEWYPLHWKGRPERAPLLPDPPASTPPAAAPAPPGNTPAR